MGEREGRRRHEERSDKNSRRGEETTAQEHKVAANRQVGVGGARAQQRQGPLPSYNRPLILYRGEMVLVPRTNRRCDVNLGEVKEKLGGLSPCDAWGPSRCAP